MLKKSLISSYSSLRSKIASYDTITKTIILMAFSCLVLSLGYGIHNLFSRGQVAEITELPATPPVTPPPTPTINWQTPDVSLQADGLEISTNTVGAGSPSKVFHANPSQINNFTLHSDPAYNHGNYTTLKATWRENDVEMRLYMYFEAYTETLSGGYSTESQAYEQGFQRKWRLTRVNTYNGNNPGNWVDSYSGGTELFTPTLMGSSLYIPYVELSTSGGGYFHIKFTNIRLQAFTNECIPNPCPLEAACRLAPLPSGSEYCPIASASPTPPPTADPSAIPVSCRLKTYLLPLGMDGWGEQYLINPSTTTIIPGQKLGYVVELYNFNSYAVSGPLRLFSTNLNGDNEPVVVDTWRGSCQLDTTKKTIACYNSYITIAANSNNMTPSFTLSGMALMLKVLSPIDTGKANTGIGFSGYIGESPFNCTPYTNIAISPVPTPSYTPYPSSTPTPPSPPPACYAQEVNHTAYRESYYDQYSNTTQYHFLDYTCGSETSPRTIGSSQYYSTENSLLQGAQFYCRQNSCPLTPSPSVSPICTRQIPRLELYTNDSEGYPGETLTYTAVLTNQDTQPCGSSQFSLSPHLENGWSSHLSDQTIWIPAGATASIVFQVTSTTNPWHEIRSIPVSLRATNTQTDLGISATASYTLLAPKPQTFDFRLSLNGVEDNAAEGAQINLKFYLKDGTIKSLETPLTLSHVYGGVYQALATIDNPLPPETQFRIKVKGEKHVSTQFCRSSGQTDRCADNEYMTTPNPLQDKLSFYFADLPLPPGDLPPQDGKTDMSDLNRIKTLMGISQSNLTPEDLTIGDLNYDGHINVYDAFLILKTMEIRYDD